VYRDPGEDPISFGDIFESDHLIDVYAARDARALGGGPMDRRAAKKIAEQNNREFTDRQSEQVPLYTPAMEQHPDKSHALAHGSNMKLSGPNRAILLADSCAVDTALAVGRDGRRKRGRLLFAPVVLATTEDVERLTDMAVFGRFPLAACELFDHGAIAELRYCFNVDVAEVNGCDRILALKDEAAEELEVAWGACTLRRGPLATARNVERLEGVIGQRGDAVELEGLAESIGQVVDVGWRIEGGLDGAAEASLSPETVDQLTSALSSLEDAVRDAQQRLGKVKPN
jgi:hypothetical protein